MRRAIQIAEDNSHGYSQANRWGPDYDCSSMVCQVFEDAGIPLKTCGGTPCMNGILWIGDNARGRQPVKIVQMSGNVIEVKDCIQNGETIYYERRADQ